MIAHVLKLNHFHGNHKRWKKNTLKVGIAVYYNNVTTELSIKSLTIGSINYCV